MVCAERSQLILAAGGVAKSADAQSFASNILGMEQGNGLPTTVLADTGFASAKAVAALKARNIEPLGAIGRTQPHGSYDYRPPLEPRIPRPVTEPWRLAMLANQAGYATCQRPRRPPQADRQPRLRHHQGRLRIHSVHLRGLAKVTTEWTLTDLAFNCRMLHRQQQA